MVTLTGVSKWYFGDTKVLDQVSLDLKRGDFVYVVGGSGAGKSSLLRMLATEEPPSAGTVKLFGYDMDRVSSSTLREIRRSLGYVPQGVRLIPDLSVQENIELFASISRRGRKERHALRAKMGELMEKLGLAPKRGSPAAALSGGEAQRVAVARALVRSPELIVADEPTGAQDNTHTWGLMDLFLKANAGGATVVVATHDREIVRRVRRRCAILREGRLAMDEGAACIY